MRQGQVYTELALYARSRVAPGLLPKRIPAWRDACEHHPILKLATLSAATAWAVLEKTLGKDWFPRDEGEAKKAAMPVLPEARGA